MPCQIHVPEAPFPQFLTHLVLTKTTAGIEILTPGGIEHSLVLKILEVVLEVFSTIRVEQPNGVGIEEFLDVVETNTLVGCLYLEGLSGAAGAVVDVELSRRGCTIFSSAFF